MRALDGGAGSIPHDTGDSIAAFECDVAEIDRLAPGHHDLLADEQPHTRSDHRQSPRSCRNVWEREAAVFGSHANLLASPSGRSGERSRDHAIVGCEDQLHTEVWDRRAISKHATDECRAGRQHELEILVTGMRETRYVLLDRSPARRDLDLAGRTDLAALEPTIDVGAATPLVHHHLRLPHVDMRARSGSTLVIDHDSRNPPVGRVLERAADAKNQITLWRFSIAIDRHRRAHTPRSCHRVDLITTGTERDAPRAVGIRAGVGAELRRRSGDDHADIVERSAALIDDTSGDLGTSLELEGLFDHAGKALIDQLDDAPVVEL